MIDMFGIEPHFVDHLAAVWHALPVEARGQFIVPSNLRDRARARGIPEAGPDEADKSRPLLVASWGDESRSARRGRTRIAYIEHGAGQSYPGDRKLAGHPSYAGGGKRVASLFLVPNDYAAAMWRAAYPGRQVEVVGCPRLGTLPSRDGGDAPSVVAVSFHWDGGLVMPELHSAFGHYRGVLPDLANRFRIVGHAHPRALDGPPRVRRYLGQMGIEVVEDFADVLRRAAVYVCDNSSSLFEFASTGRPVVVLNAPWYRRNVHHGGRFWDWAPVGINVDRPEDLGDAIERALADPPEVRAERERVLRLVYAHRDGSAAQRAVSALLAWADDIREEAA